MEARDADHEVVIICLLCCFVASALSAAFAYTIAKAQMQRPSPRSEPEPEIKEILDPPQPATVTEVRFRANASFM